MEIGIDILLTLIINMNRTYSMRVLIALGLIQSLVDLSVAAKADYFLSEFHTKWFWTRPKEGNTGLLVTKL